MKYNNYMSVFFVAAIWSNSWCRNNF